MSATEGDLDPRGWGHRAPAIFGCSGTRLSEGERAFFARTAPVGAILFARNVVDPHQLRALVSDLRESVGDADLPVLVDQEGGRVARLKPPHWRAAPAAGRFGALYRTDPAAALAAVRLNAELIARELSGLGIDVDCLPLLDVRQDGADAVIGDRAFSDDPSIVAALGRAAVQGLADGGCQPVIKHLPGHGRATADSHHRLPVVATPADQLEAVDFAPFRAFGDAPWGMTAHIVYTAFDAERPATLSPVVIEQVVRGRIGFDGVLMSDDIEMGALSGGLAERAVAALGAGCDLVLHCSGKLERMQSIATALPPMRRDSAARLQRCRASRPAAPGERDLPAAERELQALMASA